MTNELMNFQNTDDGWSDAAADYAENLLRGELLKCVAGHWLTGKEAAPLPSGMRMVALGTAAAWVRWSEGRPAEYRVRRPGEHLPDREDLGDTDKDKWEAGPDGKPRDPWQNTRFLWLTDPTTAQLYTFSTATWSGRDAVIGLGDQITRMRTGRPGVSPVVEFQSAPLQTKYGRQMKPILKIVGWVGGSEQTDAPARIAGNVKKLNDSIPF